ncbi:MAG: flagellar biosynthesis protein FlhB [Nitrospiraceae bacterium]|nr:flagellar biosynthesis protein FlhB [Nitrospiraceae bacterium]
MAEQDTNKTEPATEKRKEEARRQGQIPISRDVSTAAVLLGGIGLLAALLPAGMRKMTEQTRQGLSLSWDSAMTSHLTIDGVHTIVVQTGTIVLLLVLPIVLGIALIGTGVSLAQTGFLWRTEALQFDMARLNPLTGLSKIASLRSVMELIKGLLKIAVITGVGLFVMRNDVSQVPGLIQYDMSTALHVTGRLALKAALAVSGAIALLAGLDYLYQRYEWERSLRMSKEEIKEEQKASEGDPLIRNRVRAAQRDLAKKRMMAAVKTADVVVTNPTHLAVALKYDATKMAAPFVVAKGAGFVAERIRELARHHGVAVVENKFVARTLYKLVDIGQDIPANLYRAVAEILAFVYRAKGVTPGHS